MNDEDLPDVSELLQRFGSDYGLRVPLPDRLPPLDAERCMALELAIHRAWHLPPSAKRVLLTILQHTEWRSHVCYQSRAFLIGQTPNAGERRWSLTISRFVEAGLLSRLAYHAHHSDLRRGSVEWYQGAWFLRWEATGGIPLAEALRKVRVSR